MMMRRTKELKLTQAVFTHAGIDSKDQRQRAVEALQRTGLYEIERNRGKCPVAREP
jgi:hypothetical protein